MALSEPLRLGDKLREALADAQKVLDSTDLRGKVKLEMVSAGPSVSSVESSMDRTEADAKHTASESQGGGVESTGPLSPNDRLLTALEKLIKSMDGVPDAMEKGTSGRGRPRKGPAVGEAPGEESSPGYLNPYILQGMVTNPLGTGRSLMGSVMSGGSGMGMKAPDWLKGAMEGSGGEFSVGRALGAPTLAGEGGAATYMSGGAIGAAGAATFLASFLATLKIQENIAGDRAKDAGARVADYRMGNATGVNFRAGAWRNEFQSRDDVDIQDVQGLMQSSGVGWGRMQDRVGPQGMVGNVQAAVNSALNVGISSGQMGQLLGAATRSGTIDLGGENGTKQMLTYLGLIEQWTKTGKDYGLSTAESLQKLASFNSLQAGASSGIVTMGAQRTFASMQANVMGQMPSDIMRPGTDAVMGAVMAPSNSDTQTVLEMNEYLENNHLTATGQAWAEEALGKDVVQAMRKRYGASADVFIAQAAVSKGGVGGARGKMAAMKRMEANGASPLGPTCSLWAATLVRRHSLEA
jgi:hypothetical protein